MWQLLPPPPVCDLRHRSETVLATWDRVPPSALPVSLGEHPVWHYLATQDGSAYERNCKVADPHRARLEGMHAATHEEKQSHVLVNVLPIRHHEKKDSPKDKTTDNLTFIVAHFEGRSCQRLTPNLAACSAPSTSACSDLHKTTKHKLVRKRGYVDLRGQTLA